jgi:hypothetical protein
MNGMHPALLPKRPCCWGHAGKAVVSTAPERGMSRAPHGCAAESCSCATVPLLFCAAVAKARARGLGFTLCWGAGGLLPQGRAAERRVLDDGAAARGALQRRQRREQDGPALLQHDVPVPPAPHTHQLQKH